MQKLNFPTYSFRFKNKENKIAVFSILRKKFLTLTPEEWVRQHCIHYLIEEKNYPKSLLNEEKQVLVNGISKRYDIVGYKKSGEIRLIVECKAPSIRIKQNTFDQIAQYNMQLKADYLMLTNGINHYFCQMDWKNQNYSFLRELPQY
ncbi:MAG: type I restriction enzyme HsdR N-terminal domain-containing protein [Bacteroidota bacterium]